MAPPARGRRTVHLGNPRPGAGALGSVVVGPRGVGAGDPGRVLGRRALLRARAPRRAPWHDLYGHADRARRHRRLWVLGVAGPVGATRDRADGVLRHRRRDRDADPRRQDPRGSRARDGRRCVADALVSHAGAGRARDRRRGGSDRAGRAPTRDARGRVPRRDGAGRRRGRRGCVVRRPFPADRGIGARRRGAGQRGGRGLGQRARPAGGVRVDGRRADTVRRDRAGLASGAGDEGPGPAPRRPDLLGLRPGRARPRRSDVPRVDSCSAPRRRAPRWCMRRRSY